jgi:hypothetical protein
VNAKDGLLRQDESSPLRLRGDGMKKEQLLAEVEGVLRTMPTMEAFNHESENNCSWLGRAAAVIQAWNFLETPFANIHIRAIEKYPDRDQRFTHDQSDYRSLKGLLHKARTTLQMETVGPLSLSVPTGAIFDYFDEIRKVVEEARQDVLFVDPYLDAEFVSRYLPHIAPGVNVRLLTSNKLPALLSASDAFVAQNKAKVHVRSSMELHDRYVFVDRERCFHSGASFKDGAKKSPTTLTQIIDAFAVVLQTYESMWNAGKVER